MIIIGNSHVSLFRNGHIIDTSNNQAVKVNWVGALTILHFINNSSAARKVRQLIMNEPGWKLLSIGMHDIIRVATIYNQPSYGMEFNNVLYCYQQIFNELNQAGKLGWLIFPQQTKDIGNANVRADDIYQCSRAFNDRLTEWCIKNSVPVINPLINFENDKGQHYPEFYQADDIHLNNRALPFYLEEINRQTRSSIKLTESAEPQKIDKPDLTSEPESFAVLVAEELGLSWNRTNIAYGGKPAYDLKISAYLANKLQEAHNMSALDLNDDFIAAGNLSSTDLVDIYAYASDTLGLNLNFDVKLRDLNSVNKLTRFLYQKRPLCINDFTETLKQSNSPERAPEIWIADEKIARLDRDAYARLKQIIHSQTEGWTINYGIIFFWLALVEAANGNHQLALRLLFQATSPDLGFPFIDPRVAHYRKAWQNSEAITRPHASAIKTRPIAPTLGYLHKLNALPTVYPQLAERIETIHIYGTLSLGEYEYLFQRFRNLVKIHIFMPILPVHHQLRQTQAQKDNIEIHHFLISASNEPEILVTNQHGSHISIQTGTESDTPAGRILIAECLSIDQFIKQHPGQSPDLIMSNIEGLEAKLINGAAGKCNMLYLNHKSISPINISKTDYFAISEQNLEHNRNATLLVHQSLQDEIMQRQQMLSNFTVKAICPTVVSLTENKSDANIDLEINQIVRDQFENACKLLSDGFVSEALDALTRTIEIDPDNCAALLTLSRLLAERSEHQKALHFLNQAYSRCPEEKDVVVTFATQLMLLNQYELARKICDRYLAYIPNDTDIRKLRAELEPSSTLKMQINNLIAQGETLFTSGQIQQALDLFAQLARIAPNNTTIHNNLGVIYWLFKDQQAIEHFNTCLELEPDNADAIINLGQIYIDQARFDEARRLFDQYLQDHQEDLESARIIMNMKLALRDNEA